MRNVNSHFSMVPHAEIQRSRFNRSSSYKTTFNVGDLIPFYVDEVLPGDTHSIDTSFVCRMQPLVAPIMDNVYLDTYYYFVPNRIIWEHFVNLMGENTDSAWIPQVEYACPTVSAPDDGWQVGTIADYMGIPTGVDGFSVSALPFRAYAKIVNDWFVDQNLVDPMNCPTDDTNIVGSNGSTFQSDIVKGGKPFIAAKFHDYFTSALPAPQKGNPVSVPLGSSAPVYGSGNALWLTNSNRDNTSNLFSLIENHHISDGSVYPYLLGVSNYSDIPDSSFVDDATGLHLPTNKQAPQKAGSTQMSLDDGSSYGVATKGQLGRVMQDGIMDSGVYADLSAASTVSINELRIAFQLQKLLERDSRSGTRYIELLKSHFGVTSPDARLQRSEYLGGQRIPININQVVQTSESSATSPQGNVAAYSVTSDSHSDFTRSFTEHGWIIGLAVARYDHSYQQGLNRMWSRSTRYDWYWPVLANIGETPILNKEIYLSGDSDDDNAVFGYQEAWAEYRYKPSIVTGEMRSSYATSLDVWHLADDYASRPSLSASWIQEDKGNLDRTLAVTSAVSNQLFMDMYIKNVTTRPMPLYSIPGLIDHN